MMTSIKINANDALRILSESLDAAHQISDSTSRQINKILHGTHKTYKYILITALLAKATNEKINTIALQANAEVAGAYDARSLCHKVVVPFEREFLASALGGSNEPFLNKPARFTTLSKDNAVRKGKDRETLESLIQILSNIRTSDESFKYLSNSLLLLQDVILKNELINTITSKVTPDLIDAYSFISKFVEKSIGGETCTIAVGAMERQFYSCIKGEYKVEIHKVNQSGASSKEIGDIDIYSDNEYLYSIEVKDKNFTAHDLEHAFNKIIDNQGKKGAFIYGRHATYDATSIKNKLQHYHDIKFVTLFSFILDYSRQMLFQTPTINLNNFFEIILNVAKEINATDETKNRIHEIKDSVLFSSQGDK